MSQTIFTDGLSYEGKVTLTLKSNNRVLQTKTYKNSGTNQLFKFLGYCLIDAYEEAKQLLPNKIMLLYNTSGEEPASASPYNVTPRSNFRGLAQTPSIVSIGNSYTGQVKVTYSFEVPKAAIGGPFNQIALYGAGMTESDIYDFSAFYFLEDGFGAFEEQDPRTWSATAVLLIEWELSISNKNTASISNA